jgi:hypothetical protein
MRRAAVTLALVLVTEAATAQTTGLVGGYTVARKPRMSLVVTGAATLVGSYLLGVVTAGLVSFSGVSPYLLVPIAGPFLGFGWDRANTPRACPLDVGSPQSGCADATLVDVGLFVMGLAQVTGAVLLATGLVRHEVRTKVTVTPSFTWRGGPVFAVSGNF